MALWKELVGEMRESARQAEGDQQVKQPNRGVDVAEMNRAVIEGAKQAMANPPVKTIKLRGEDYKPAPVIMEKPVQHISMGKATQGGDAAAKVKENTLAMFSKSSTPALDAQRAESQNAIKIEVLPTKPAKRSNAEKREAVQAALNEDSGQGDRELARRLGVSHTYIAKLRGKITGNVSKSKPKSDGKVAKSKTKTGASSGGNVSTPAELWPAMLAEVKTIQELFDRIATVEEAQMLFLNLGVMLGDKNPKWLVEAIDTITPWAQAEIKRQKTSKRSDAKTSRRSKV